MKQKKNADVERYTYIFDDNSDSFQSKLFQLFVSVPDDCTILQNNFESCKLLVTLCFSAANFNFGPIGAGAFTNLFELVLEL